MNSLFSYDSKIMQLLMFIGDLMIINVLYLVCCIPIFTIGAAQAGLYTAAKVLLDKEDDTSASSAFFKGFANGFGTVTLSWGMMTVALALIIYLCLTAIAMGAPVWLCAIPMVIAALFQTLVPAFHSRFGCTAFQLIRNVFFLLFAHPIRSIATAVLIWVPLAVFLLDTYKFMLVGPIWLALYFSTAATFGYSFLKKPFTTLVNHFNKTHNPEVESPEDLLDESADDAEEI